MKIFAKKSNAGLIAILFAIGALTFFSCQKENLQPKSDAFANPDFKVLALNDAPGMPEYEALIAPLPFDFNIELSKCKNLKPSITLKVTVKDNGNEVKHAQPKYKYLWKVDGAEAGTSAELGCFCAKNATVIVTRLADNRKVAKTVRLYACDTGEAVGSYEEE
jgi:hypothetical protein